MTVKQLFPKLRMNAILTTIFTCSLLSIWAIAAHAAPASIPDDWTYWMSDPDDNGTANDYRDVQTIYYQVDDEYLYLRIQNVCDCGWDVGDHGRYKWFIDTVGLDAALQGGKLEDAEYLLMLEDHNLNTDDPSTAVHDLLGELTFMDDFANVGFNTRWGGGGEPHPYFENNPAGDPSPSPHWRRELGAGTGGFGGSHGVLGDEIGFWFEGQFVDMYISLAHIGNPDTVCLYWATDQENQNIDQAPNQDRGSSDLCFELAVKGSITINKHIEPSGAVDESFPFGGDLGAFSLDVVGGAPAGTTFSGLNAGSYDIFEDLGSLPANWLLGSIVCDDPSQNSTVDLSTGTAFIELAAGEEVVCTYTNVAAPVEGGTIIIVKHAIPHDEALFAFTSTIEGYEEFTLSDSGDEHTLIIEDLAPGPYVVTESAPPAGWHLDNLECVDADQGTTVAGAQATIDLDSGEVVTCTYTNGKFASITISKQSLPEGSGEIFGFTGSFGSFGLADGDLLPFSQLDPDSEDEYTVVEENLPMGWRLEQISCFDPTGDSSADVATRTAFLKINHGDEIFCTFTNRFNPEDVPIPALSNWMLILLAGMLGVAAYLRLRRV